MTAVCREVEAVYAANSIEYDGSGNAQYLRLLSLPSPLVWLISQLLISSDGRASMSGDLLYRRPTEIDFLNGHIVELGKRAGVPTPVNARLCDLIRAAETAQAGHPNLSGEQIAQTLEGVVRISEAGGGGFGMVTLMAMVGGGVAAACAFTAHSGSD